MLTVIAAVAITAVIAGLVAIIARPSPDYDRRDCVRTRTNSNGWRHVS